jgi:hypothetical protein
MRKHSKKKMYNELDEDIKMDMDMDMEIDMDMDDEHVEGMFQPMGQQMPGNKELAHAYVPWQFYEKAFNPAEALKKGTLFPELYGPYKPPM